MRVTNLGFLIVALGSALAGCQTSVPPGRDAREATSGAILAARSRSQMRLSEDGTVPVNALARSLAQRERLVEFGDGAGVHPAAWTYHGPTNVGGRVREVLIHPTQPTTMWTGGCSGGVWRTTNGGSSWVPMDDFMATLPIGCMALDPSNPDILYVGTGEGFFETEEGSSNTAAVRGAGIYKSTDGGLTWNPMSSTAGPNWYFVNRLAICPSNPALMVAATQTGLWRTTNGGGSWSLRHPGIAYDVRFHPTDASKLIAGFHEDGIFYSNDGGISWNPSSGEGNPHRAEVRYYRSNPNIVVAALSEGGSVYIFRSNDGGATFTQQSPSGISTYEAYNNVLWVNPYNDQHIVVGGVYLYRSTNGGTTLSQAFNNVHADMHAIVEHPSFNNTTNRTVFFGTDGGIYRATDYTTNTVSALNTGLGITQFYGAVMNPANNQIFGGTQDNGTKRVTVPGTAWSNSFGGDGGYCAYDPTDPNYWYGEIYYAQIFRSTNGGSSAGYIYSGIADAGSNAQCNFIPFFMLDPNDANRMLAGAARLWRSNNVKAATPTWTSIKPVIPGDGPPDAHMNPNPPHCISTFAIAKSNSDVIWVGHNNGNLYRTDNGTATTPSWIRVDTSQLPNRWPSTIVIDPANTNRVTVAFMGYAGDNLWRTLDGGTTWTDISGPLPDSPVSAFAEHPLQPGWLYAGTDVGLFTSSDDGQTWSTTNQGPSVVPIEQLHWVTNTKLLCVTHGRGVFSAEIVGNAEPLAPDGFRVINGMLNRGRLSDLYASDDVRVEVTADLVSTDDLYPVAVEFWTQSPHAAVSALSVKVELSTSRAGFGQRVWLRNVNTLQFEPIDVRISQTTDMVYTVLATGDLTRFIEPGTRRITGRLTWEFSASEESVPWTSAIDQILVTVTE